MICKRMLRTALCSVMSLSAVAALLAVPVDSRADIITPQSTLSQANRLSIFHDYSMDISGQTHSAAPGSAGGGLFTSVLGSWASTDTDGSGRSYEISATPFTGYDSLPESKRPGVGSAFGGVDIGAGYRIDIGPGDPTVGSSTQVRFAYDAMGVIYDGNDFNADAFQQTASATYRRSLFQDSLILSFKVADQFTTEQGIAFLNTVDAAPSVEWFVIPQVSLEAGYEYTNLEYYIHTILRRNPDADRNTVNARFHYYPTPQQRGPIPESEDVLGDILRQSLTRATIGYAAVFNDSGRNDYQYEANRLTFGMEGVRFPGVNDVSLDLTYNYEWQNYMVPSVEGPVVLAGRVKQHRRKDHLQVITLRTNARLFDLPRHRGTLDTFLQWDVIGDHANLAVRDFNEFVISAGLTFRY